MSIVGNDAESCVGCEFLHDSPESHLRCCCHGIRFVKDDEFESGQVRRAGLGNGREDLLCAAKGLDLLPYNIYASVIACVQFEDHLAHILVPIYAARECQNGGGFAGSRRAVE